MRGGQNRPTQRVAKDLFGDIELTGKPGMVFEGSLTYQASPTIRLGLGLCHQSFEIVAMDPFDFEIGEASVVSVVASVAVDLVRGPGVPYLGGALGYATNDVSTDSALSRACMEVLSQRCSIDSQDAFTPRLAFGVRHALSRRLALDAMLAWSMNTGMADLALDSRSMDEGRFNASAVSLTFGVQYAFE